MTSFLEGLPQFDPTGVNAMLWAELLKVKLTNMNLEVFLQTTYTSIVEQSTEPLQAQWEAQWVTDGHTLPIPPTSILLWWNTSTSYIGGVYGTTPLSAGVVVKRESEHANGGVSYRNIISTPTAAVSSTASIGVNNSNHPSLTFDLPVLSDLLLVYQLHVVLSSGTGTWGADFLLDGVKVGTAYNSLPSNVGIINASATGNYRCHAFVPNVAAGSHTIQVIFGVTGSPASPPTLAYGGIGAGAGQYGLRQLIVEGIAK
jgi:hypothetical protein